MLGAFLKVREQFNSCFSFFQDKAIVGKLVSINTCQDVKKVKPCLASKGLFWTLGAILCDKPPLLGGPMWWGQQCSRWTGNGLKRSISLLSRLGVHFASEYFLPLGDKWSQWTEPSHEIALQAPVHILHVGLDAIVSACLPLNGAHVGVGQENLHEPGGRNKRCILISHPWRIPKGERKTWSVKTTRGQSDKAPLLTLREDLGTWSMANRGLQDALGEKM